jgi:hypothetical protein
LFEEDVGVVFCDVVEGELRADFLHEEEQVLVVLRLGLAQVEEGEDLDELALGQPQQAGVGDVRGWALELQVEGLFDEVDQCLDGQEGSYLLAEGCLALLAVLHHDRQQFQHQNHVEQPLLFRLCHFAALQPNLLVVHVQHVAQHCLLLHHQSAQLPHVLLAVHLHLVALAQQQQAERDLHFGGEGASQGDQPALEHEFVYAGLRDFDGGEVEEQTDLTAVDVAEDGGQFEQVGDVAGEVLIGFEEEEFDEFEYLSEEFDVGGIFQFLLFLEEQFDDAVEEAELRDHPLRQQIDVLLFKVIFEYLVGFVHDLFDDLLEAVAFEGGVVVVDVVEDGAAEGVIEFV